MNIGTLIGLVKKSPTFAAMVRAELEKDGVPAPADLNELIVAQRRRPESTNERADRLTGFLRNASRPVSEAPSHPRVAAAGDVAAPPSIGDRLRQLRKRA